MHPVHDADVSILMAVTLAAKRRPAELMEIVAAAELLHGMIPFPEKLGDAIERLSRVGLVSVTEGGFTLTAVAQEIMARPSRKAATEEVMAIIRAALADFVPSEEFPAVTLTPEQLMTAIRTHKASRKAPGKNLLMPKPKVDRHFKVEGRWRRASSSR